MNDFELRLVDWNEMLERFEREQIGSRIDQAIAEKDYDTASEISQEFMHAGIDYPNPLSANTLLPGNRAAESFKIWCAFGSSYSSLRKWIFPETAAKFDSLYLPFVEPWAGFNPELQPLFQLPDSMKNLRMSGLTMAMSPDHVHSLAPLCRTHTFSYLIHCVANTKQKKFPLPMAGSEFDPTATGQDEILALLHASYTEATEGWRRLLQIASRKNFGIMAIFEI